MADSKIHDAFRVFQTIHDLRSRAERKSYYQLTEPEKELVRELEETERWRASAPRWSIVPHPTLIRQLVANGGFRRYIVTIDALRSSIYTRVEEFLQSIENNIAAYYTGGWADFICDVQLSPDKFDDFRDELRRQLKDAGIERLVVSPDAVLSVFQVEESVILQGKHLATLAQPGQTTINTILQERLEFEVLLANYRSEEATALFGSETKIEEHLAWLEQNNAIVGYRLIWDFPRFEQRDYVPMILGSGPARVPLERLLQAGAANPKLLSPVIDLLRVKNLQATDDAEGSVNFFFINEYDFPGEKHEWKTSVYSSTDADVNLYNYPLEGTLKETPIFLSELPRITKAVAAYACPPNGILLGRPTNQIVRNSTVCLDPGGLFAHGITLGEPGSGKTNVDLLVAVGAARSVTRVIILDASGSIAGKANALAQELGSRPTVAEVTTVTEFRELLWGEGLIVVQAQREQLPELFSSAMDLVEASPDATQDGASRLIHSLLLVEESFDAFGTSVSDRQDRFRRLVQFLNKAYRKGWCLWLSLQLPSTLGLDSGGAADMLKLLRNRLIGRISDNAERELLKRVFADEGHSVSELEGLVRNLPTLAPGALFCRGVVGGGAEANQRPLLEVASRLLGQREPLPSGGVK